MKEDIHVTSNALDIWYRVELDSLMLAVVSDSGQETHNLYDA